ncbi:DUF3068 domain-containing protein [Nocardioides panacisoli]|uniref:DUF3068 domain-containing protein n=1 Tax=Nocardioides panacisoli TaxID=627624 RepID=UPI0031D6B4CB
MSRSAPHVLVGLGVFLIVAAGLVRFYAYPALAKVPSSYDTTTELDAQGAQVLNFKTFQPETHDLAIEARTLSDPSATPPDGVAIWQTSTTVRREDDSVFQQTRDMTPFDDVTGEAVSCDGCPSWVAEGDGDNVKEVPVERDGLTLKFPFDTQKKDYQVWDDTVGKATTATYEGTDEIQGLTVYKFVQEIPESVVETREVPGSMFGSDKASVDAEMVYGMTRTFYIEPVTGSPVNRVEVRTQELSYDGQSVPVFDGTVQYTDDQVSTEVDDLSSKAMVLGSLRMMVPLAFLLIGLLAVAAGLLLNRRATRDDVDAPSRDGKPLVNA